MNAIRKDYESVWSKEQEAKAVELEKRERDARDAYDQWNRSGPLSKAFTKSEGARRKLALDDAKQEWLNQVGNLNHTTMNMEVDRVNQYFDKKKRRDVMAWLASEYGYYDD